MRMGMFIVIGLIALTSIGRAQEARPAQRERPTSLPEVVVSSQKHGPSEIDRCVEVQVGSSKSLDCINQKLKQKVDRVNPPILNTPPIDARSPDTKIGVINIPGVQQQYGRNFGQSAFPYRPPAPVYGSPLGRH